MARQDDAQYVKGTEGDDVMVGSDDSDLFWGLGGNDILRGEGGWDTLVGHEGNDQLFGGDGNDLLEGGGGNDLAYGGAGDDTLRDFDDGDDVLWGEDGDDHLDVRRQQNLGENLFLSGGAGNDVIDLRVYGGNFYSPVTTAAVDGGSGDDALNVFGPWLDSTVALGSGNDLLIIGGGGAHQVSLGSGHDVVQLSGGGGAVRISDFTPGDDGDRIDLSRSLQMWGVSYEPGTNPFSDPRVAQLRQVGDDVQVRLGGAIAIILENTTIADLTAVNFSGLHPDGRAGHTGGSFFGSARSEQVRGSHGDDVMEGLDGDDHLIGEGGDDVLSGGDGIDRLEGGAGDDTLYGGAGDDEIVGGGWYVPSGNDTAYGGAGNDTISLTSAESVSDWARAWGGDGDDRISAGHEVRELFVDGGAGNDNLSVRNADRWEAHGGSGDDTLGLARVAREPGLFFGEGVFDGGAGHDIVIFGQHMDDMEIVFVDEDTFRIGDSLFHNVEGFRFLGGPFGGDVVRDLSDSFRGLSIEASAGDDVLIGTAFDDVLSGYEGEDLLDGGAGYDTAVFQGDFSHFVVEIQADGSVIVAHAVVPEAYGPDILRNVERLQFDDGWYTLDGTYIAAVVDGTEEADEISGKSWSDTLFAGGGDDLIRHTGGADVIDGGAGTDVLQVDVGQAFFTLLAVGDDFLLKGPGGDTALLKSVETIRFRDGEWDLHRMYGPTTGSAGAGKAEEPQVLPGCDPIVSTPEPATIGWSWRDLPGDLSQPDVETGPLVPSRDDHFF